ncbi:MAG TPA: B12-binding domain-containing radical SAM protein [Mesoaciditoga lauensis]|nr:B12-binding domain-containing radical SAM protein [Mesoaciditoga lauensis]
MKILLVNPINPSYYYRFGLIFPPLGLGYLSAVLKQHEHEVKIVDMNVEKFDFQNYHYADYDLVGISSDTVRFPWAEYIAKRVRAQGVKVVMGGPHPSVDAYNILKSKTADYVVLGEGEESFVNLVSAIEKGERYPNIGGVGYVNENGEVHLSAMRFISDLDSIPFPDWDGLSLERYNWRSYGKRSMSIISSRGCPFDCEFCSVSQLMGRLWRKRSVDNVFEEMKILVKKYGYEFLVFFDDNFTVDPKRVISLSEKVLKNDLHVNCFAFSRTDEIVGHEDMVEAMSKAGCKMLFIGFETANEEAMEEFNKKESVSIAYDAVKILKRYHIDVFASFILGALSDTKESVKKTVKFAKSLNSVVTEFSILTPIPGTRLYKKLEPDLITKDYSLYDMTHLVFKHPNFTPEELRKIFINAYISIYSTPGKIFTVGLPYLKKIITTRKKYNELQKQIELLKG